MTNVVDWSNFSLNSVPDVDPNAIPTGKKLLSELVEVRPWEYEGKWQLGLTFQLDAAVEPPFSGRRKDRNFKITGATADNVYWMKQFFFEMGIPKETVNSWVGLAGIVKGLRQYVGRKFVIQASKRQGYINITSVEPYQPVPGAGAQALPTAQPTAAAPAQAATPPAAPSAAPAAPAADPWAQAAQAAQTAQAPNALAPNAPAADPWAQQAAQAPQQNPTAAAGVTAGPPATTPTANAPATPAANPAGTSNNPEDFDSIMQGLAQPDQGIMNTL